MKHEAFNPAQIVTQLRPWTRVIEVMDEKTGKPTGKYKPVVDMPDVDATTNEQVIMNRSPEEAVKRMKEMPEQWGNLFRSNVVSGIGSSSATGGLMPGQGGRSTCGSSRPRSIGKSGRRTLNCSDWPPSAASASQGSVNRRSGGRLVMVTRQRHLAESTHQFRRTTMNRLYLSQPFVACYDNNLDAYIPELWRKRAWPSSKRTWSWPTWSTATSRTRSPSSAMW